MDFTHSIMFHHFHNDAHLPSQGSLSPSDFSDMLLWLSNRYNLIGANEYLRKFERSQLGANDICLSFDDALLCQYDIAVPILEQYGVDAFFFVYSSAFHGVPHNLEVFRYFRTNSFSDIEDFYVQFFELYESVYHGQLHKHLNQSKDLKYLMEHPIYTDNDRLFRFVRNEVLGVDKYEELMLHFMKIKGFSSDGLIDKLWMSEANLEDLARCGHLVGLHSTTHPTQMSKLSKHRQFVEYKENFDHLTSIIGDVLCMSHPCGDYNDDTINVLEELGIRIDFVQIWPLALLN